jgi:hypothetical protein
MRRQTKKEATLKAIGKIREMGTILLVCWNVRNHNVTVDSTKIDTASNERLAKKSAKKYANEQGLTFIPSRK